VDHFAEAEARSETLESLLIQLLAGRLESTSAFHAELARHAQRILMHLRIAREEAELRWAS